MNIIRDIRGRFSKGSDPYTKRRGHNSVCSRCGKIFYLKHDIELKGGGKFCSIECKNAPTYKQCKICRKKFRLKPSQIDKRSTCSRKCYAEYRKSLKPFWLGKKRANISGENNWQWKGENASYIALHSWIYRKKGNPIYCNMKDGTCKGTYEWANVSHEYKRDLDDFMSLCKSHHARYDKK